METSFVKMHGLGNDFVLFDGLSQQIELSPAQIRRLADRRFGIGCDQVLLIEPATRGDAHVRYRIFNADGGEVEQCGNGSRCVAKYLHDKGVIDAAVIVAETAKGVVKLYCQPGGAIKVDMGIPRLQAADVPILTHGEECEYQITLGKENVCVYAVSMGNPHAVIRVQDVESAPVQRLGAQIGAHALFPESVNVGFMEIVDRAHIRLRVYERGVGETLACGTGACAAVVVGRLQGLLDNEVDVRLPGGHLSVEWEGLGSSVWMSGPATWVFRGMVDL